MLHGSTIRTAFHQIKGEGFFYLYRGMLPPLAQRTFSLSLMFGVYDGVKTPMINELNWNPYFAKTVAGLFAGTVEAVLMPFERIQTVLADATYHEHYKNTHHALRLLVAEHGFRELYRGIIPILWRNGPSNSLFFVMREEANNRLPKQVHLNHNILWLSLTSFPFLAFANSSQYTRVSGWCLYRCFPQFSLLPHKRAQGSDAIERRWT